MDATSVPDVERAPIDATATNEVFRDIARGGVAGLIVGVLLAGIGGRLVMRLAALLVPDAAGSVTEQGFVIGVISFAGTMGLVSVMGLFGGATVGAVWVDRSVHGCRCPAPGGSSSASRSPSGWARRCSSRPAIATSSSWGTPPWSWRRWSCSSSCSARHSCSSIAGSTRACRTRGREAVPSWPAT